MNNKRLETNYFTFLENLRIGAWGTVYLPIPKSFFEKIISKIDVEDIDRIINEPRIELFKGIERNFSTSRIGNELGIEDLSTLWIYFKDFKIEKSFENDILYLTISSSLLNRIQAYSFKNFRLEECPLVCRICNLKSNSFEKYKNLVLEESYIKLNIIRYNNLMLVDNEYKDITFEANLGSNKWDIIKK